MVNYDVPFYSNTPDDTHCFQAALKMVLKYFQPEKDYSFEELDKVTAKVEGMWTWPYAGLIWLAENGFEVKSISLMDRMRFANEGYEYLVEFYGTEKADANRKHSDLEQEQRLARLFEEKKMSETRLCDMDDIKRFLDEGYLVKCTVNARTFGNKGGYAGHAVIVKGYDADGFIIHDPGLPPIENRKVPYDLFEKAWAYPDERSRNITAIRLNG